MLISSSFSYLLPVFAVIIGVLAVYPQDLNMSPARSSGAAYFMTNNLSGNQVLSMDIASNGTLSGITATSTGGLGGYCDCVGPDPLNSQGSIKTNAAAKILVTVNAGSNSLSMFKIDLANPAKLKMVRKPVFSGGEFPVSLAINDQGTMVCVLNGGAVNGVNCYKPDLKLGLIPIPNTLRFLGLNLTTPPGPLGSASQVMFSKDGRTLIAAVKGNVPATPGFLAAWAIGLDGSLSAEAVISTAPQDGLFPFSITLIPGTNAVLVSDANVGFDIFNFGAENSLSATSSIFPIPGQGATCWSSFSSKSGNFYLTDFGLSIINEVKVAKNLTGTLVKQYPQAPGSATMDTDIAAIGDNDFLYVLAANTTTVNVLNVNIAGQAVTVQNFNFASAAEAAGVTLNPNFLQGLTTFVN